MDLTNNTKSIPMPNLNSRDSDTNEPAQYSIIRTAFSSDRKKINIPIEIPRGIMPRIESDYTSSAYSGNNRSVNNSHHFITPQNIAFDEKASLSPNSPVHIRTNRSSSLFIQSATHKEFLHDPMAYDDTKQPLCGVCAFEGTDIISDSCQHQFHSDCLDLLNNRTSCPVCHKPVLLFYPVSLLNIPIPSIDLRLPSPTETSIVKFEAMDEGKSLESIASLSSSSYTPENLVLSNAKRKQSKIRKDPKNSKKILTKGDHRHLKEDQNDWGKSNHSSSRICKVENCFRYVRSRGLCKGHGGGLRCKYEGCGLGDQGGGYCIAHGGGRRCSVEGCYSSCQSRGLCKLHGGGSRCVIEGCNKSSQGGGLCRTHGGGKRCQVEGCTKTDRRGGFCGKHGTSYTCKFGNCTKTRRIGGYCTKHLFFFTSDYISSNASSDSTTSDMH